MKDVDNLDIRLHDQVSMAGYDSGVVVCDFDHDHYAHEFPKTDWEHLKVGILVRSKKIGLVHFSNQEQVFTEQLKLTK